MREEHYYGSIGAGLTSTTFLANVPMGVWSLLGALVSSVFVGIVVPLAVAYIREALRCRVERAAAKITCPMAPRVAAIEKQLTQSGPTS